MLAALGMATEHPKPQAGSARSLCSATVPWLCTWYGKPGHWTGNHYASSTRRNRRGGISTRRMDITQVVINSNAREKHFQFFVFHSDLHYGSWIPREINTGCNCNQFLALCSMHATTKRSAKREHNIVDCTQGNSCLPEDRSMPCYEKSPMCSAHTTLQQSSNDVLR
jgi:hypothetical protein